MQRVLAFCELDWDANCAEIDTTATSRERDTVKQVTGRDSKTSISLEKPIFESSIHQWRDLITARGSRNGSRRAGSFLCTTGRTLGGRMSDTTTDRSVTIITWHYVRDGAPADLHARQCDRV